MTVSFGELSQVISESRQVDDAVLAIAKIENTRPLNDRDRNALAFAREFLRNVKNGSRWLAEEKQQLVDSNTTRYFSSLVKAVDSMGSSRTLDKFATDIDTLLKSAEALADGKQLDVESIRALRKFFNGVLTSSLDQVDAVFAPAPFPRPSVA